MKKLLAFILATLMLLSIVACDIETLPNNKNDYSSQNQTNGNTLGNNQTDNPGNKNEITFSGPVAVDNSECTIKVTEIDPDNIWGYTVKLFLLNKTNKNVMFSVDKVSVNGYMADPFFAKSVSAEKCAFSSMSWSDTIFEENGITSIEEIEFNLRVYNVDDWFEDDLVNKTVSLTP